MAGPKSLRKLAFLLVGLTLCLVSTSPQAAPSRTAELVADAETGRIIHGSNINSPRHPASLTKVMTLYMTFAALEQGRLTLDDYMPVSWNAASQQPSRLGLDEGGRLKVSDAIYGLVTESANDASVVLGEAIGGTEDRFARMMTQQARALGMKNTTYRNANGLHDPEQVTTAFDQAILARAMLFHFPQYYKYFRTRSFTYDGVSHRNHNRLMTRYEGMDGIKTGYVRASGFNLMASAKRNNKRLIGIVFGGKSAVTRDNRMATIMDASFDRVYAEERSGKKFLASATVPMIPADMNEAEAKQAAANQNIPNQEMAQGDAQPEDIAPVNAAAEPSQNSVVGENVVSNEQPTKAKKAAAKRAATNGKWGVQVGTFSNRANGLKAIKKARAKAPDLKNATAKVVSAKTGNRTIYRARLSGLDEQTARSACVSLISYGSTCLTLPPRG